MTRPAAFRRRLVQASRRYAPARSNPGDLTGSNPANLAAGK